MFRYNTFRNCCGALTLRSATRATVEGNFFLGDGKSNAGGVRVIGEGHRIVNNYFGGLSGAKYRSALSIMNGVPGSPVHLYFQTRDAVIAFNTFVNNRCTFHIGLGASEQVCLPPLNCTIANNIIVSDRGPLIVETAKPENLRWLGNLAFGAELGIPRPQGITLTEPKLVMADDGLWRPAGDSPAIGAAPGEFPKLAQDIDGQPRSDPKDIGCDQRSDTPVLRRPLTRADVGPEW